MQGDYIRRAVEIAKDIDPTRPTSIAFAGYPSAGCQSEYAPLDIVGVNEYFGWYPGPGGKLFDRNGLGPLPGQRPPLLPAARDRGDGVRRRGQPRGPGGGEGHLRPSSRTSSTTTWACSRSKPWLSGAVYWALNEFRVKPDWEGGNPRPEPPVHQKGLLTYDTMSRKPAWADVQRFYSGTNQYP